MTFKSLVLVGYVVIKILENQSIKPTRQIIGLIQCNAVYLATIGCCRSSVNHILVKAAVVQLMGIQMNPIGILEYIFIINRKINGCRCGDKARRYTRVRYRIRCVRVIVARQIIRKHSIFFVGVVPVSKKNILLCVGFCRRGFLCVDGMVWRGSRIGSARRGFVRQGWGGRGGVRIGGGSLIFCRFLGFAVIVRNRCCIVYRVSRFCSRLVRSGRGISFTRNRFRVGYNRLLRRFYTLA